MHSLLVLSTQLLLSLDVAAAMMEPPGGRALVEESILKL